MKERKLTILLALLAALALVFAAGCESNGADGGSSGGGSNEDGSGNGNGNGATDYTSAVSGRTFTYEIDGNDAHGDGSSRTTQADVTYLNSVSLAFNSTTNAVEVAVEYLVCTYAGEASTGYETNDHYSDEDTSSSFNSGDYYYTDSEYSASITTASYTYTEASGVDSDTIDTVTVTLPAGNGNSAVTLTFEVTKDGSNNVTALAIDDDESSASYTVAGTDDDGNTDGTGIDLFGNGVTGALADNTSFELSSGGTP